MNETERIVREFLRLLEARDLDGAKAYLAQDALIIFPGDARFSDLSQLVEWAKPRYRRVAKSIDRIDTACTDDGDVAICQGTLYGVWPDGRQFENIRFVDWFLLEDGLIKRQNVWNDIADTQAQDARRA